MENRKETDKAVYKSVVRGLPSERWHKAAKSSALFSCSSVRFWAEVKQSKKDGSMSCVFSKTLVQDISQMENVMSSSKDVMENS